MYGWEFFETGLPRQENAHVYEENDRPELEQRVAEQIATLLSLYGELGIVDLPTSYIYPEAAEDEDEVVPYRAIEMDPIDLDDDSEVIIFQLSVENNCDITPGIHYLEHLDEYGNVIRRIKFCDPSLNNPRPVLYDSKAGGTRLEMEVLGELHELLGITIATYIKHFDANDPPLDTTSYPASVSGLSEVFVAAPIPRGAELN